VLGGEEMIGRGAELQNMWFVEERIHIAARCVGAMRRLLDETVAWTLSRAQGGVRIHDHQGVSFPLADSAADAVMHATEPSSTSSDARFRPKSRLFLFMN
jgi:alkylation response protein AidB-like acyl-CoA dehydrogenase